MNRVRIEDVFVRYGTREGVVVRMKNGVVRGFGHLGRMETRRMTDENDRSRRKGRLYRWSYHTCNIRFYFLCSFHVHYQEKLAVLILISLKSMRRLATPAAGHLPRGS